MWEKTLKDYISNGNLPLPKHEIITQICNGLKYLHNERLSIIHRDINPMSILFELNKKTNNYHVVISDCIYAKEMDQSFVFTSTRYKGTEGWISPELADRKDITPASDVFSLGLEVSDTEEKAWELANRQPIPFQHDLESCCNDVFVTDWFSKIMNDPTIKNEFQNIFKPQPGTQFIKPIYGNYRKYDRNKMCDLLRIIRNYKNHYRDISINDLVNNLMTIFPMLLFKIYLIVRTYAVSTDPVYRGRLNEFYQWVI
uniref:Protein kinase domain-containing protein n=1 Tax=Acrobeloides nanus TaxID=290746 RepID=A0A914E524_9BILA